MLVRRAVKSLFALLNRARARSWVFIVRQSERGLVWLYRTRLGAVLGRTSWGGHLSRYHTDLALASKRIDPSNSLGRPRPEFIFSRPGLEPCPSEVDIRMSTSLWSVVHGWFGWTSLEGYRQLGWLLRDQVRLYWNWQWSKFCFDGINRLDRLLWRFWWFLTSCDMRTEYFKQLYFLNYFTGCLPRMGSFGLFGDMHDEWFSHPINGRKQPVWNYLRWRWDYQWRPQWLTGFARWVYRRSVYYRWRDFLLLPEGGRNRWIRPEIFARLLSSRWRTRQESFLLREWSVALWWRAFLLRRLTRLWSRRLRRLTLIGKLLERFKRRRARRRWNQGNLHTFRGRIIRREGRVLRREFHRFARKFRRFLQRRSRPVSHWLVPAVPDYRGWREHDFQSLIDPNPLTLDTVIDDYDFFKEKSEFEFQQDDDSDDLDEGSSDDYVFGQTDFNPSLTSPFDEAIDRYRRLHSPSKRYERKRRWRRPPFRYSRRYLRRFTEDIVSFNLRSPLFDGERLVPAGDGPNVDEDEFYPSHRANNEPKRVFRLVDWYWFRSDSQRLTERKTFEGLINWVFWHPTSWKRVVDERPRGLLGEVRRWHQEWTPFGKLRKRLVSKFRRASRWRSYRQIWRRRESRYRLASRVGRRKWRFFNLWSTQDLLSVHRPNTSMEIGGRRQRQYLEFSQRRRVLFAVRHRRELHREGIYESYLARTRGRPRLSYLVDELARRLGSRVLGVGLVERVLRRKFDRAEKLYRGDDRDRTEYSPLERELNFDRRLPRPPRRDGTFQPAQRYVNDRPTPRRIQPNLHYPRYNPVYNSNRRWSDQLSGEVSRLDNFRYTRHLPPAGFLLALLAVLSFDDFWYVADWGVWPLNLWEARPPAYLFWNHGSDLDLIKPYFSQFDFFRPEFLSPHDGIQKQIYPEQIYDYKVDYYSRPGIFARRRLRHYQSFLIHERFGLWKPNSLIQWMTGKGLADWVIIPTRGLFWHHYYSPVPPLIGDKFYWLQNQMSKFRVDYLPGRSQREYLFPHFLRTSYRKFYYLLQSQRFDYHNTWVVTQFANYSFHSPRALFGSSPLRVGPRAENLMVTLFDNQLYPQRTVFNFFSLHFLGFQNYLNFPTKSLRFQDWDRTGGLPLWEGYLNSICLQNWRAAAVRPECRPFDRETLDLLDWYRSWRDGLFRSAATVLDWWSYPLRFFFFFFFPAFLLRNFRERYLARLQYEVLTPALEVLPIRRVLPRERPARAALGWGSKALFFKRRYERRKHWPQFRTFQSRRQARAVQDPLTQVRPDHRRLLRRFRKISRRRGSLRLLRLVTMHNRRNRKELGRYHRVYHDYRHRRTPIYGVRPRRRERVLDWTSFVVRRHGGLYRRRYRRILHRSVPTVRPWAVNYRCRTSPEIETSNVRRRRSRRTPRLVGEVRAGLVLARSLSESYHFRRFQQVFKPGRRRRQLVRPFRSSVGPNWLARPTELRVGSLREYQLGLEPNRSEFQRVRRREPRKKDRLYNLYALKQMESKEEWWKVYFERGWLRYARQRDLVWMTPKRRLRRYVGGRNQPSRKAHGDYNLRFRRLIEDKIRNFDPQDETRLIQPPEWVARQVQHRYHLDRYRRGLRPLGVSPVPLRQGLYPSYLRGCLECSYPGASFVHEGLPREEETNDNDYSDSTERVFGGDNSDEGATSATADEHDSLFAEYECLSFIGHSPVRLVSVRDRSYPVDRGHPYEVKHRQLLNSYRRFRSLPLEHYSLSYPIETVSERESSHSAELYWSPYSVDHPAYEQLLLTSYAVPRLYRRLRRVNKVRFEFERVQPQPHRKFYFWFDRAVVAHRRGLNARRQRWSRSRSERFRLRSARVGPRVDSAWPVEMDWPVFDPWSTQHLPDSVWPDLASQVLDHFQGHLLTQVVNSWSEPEFQVHDDECTCFFDHGPAYNVGYRWSGEYLYAVVLFRPREAYWVSLASVWSHEEGLDPDRELVSEDLNRPLDPDPESIWLEWLCTKYFEADLFWFHEENHSDLEADQHVEDPDDDESDHLEEVDFGRVPHYLPLTVLAGWSPGETHPDSLRRRLNNHHRTVSFDRYQRAEWSHGLGRVTDDFDLPRLTQLAWRAVTPRRRQFVLHWAMEAGLDPVSLDLSDKVALSDNLLRIWALTDVFLEDSPHGWVLDY